MKSLFFLFMAMNSVQSVHAQVLLVPDSKMEFSNYRQKCKKDGYFCTFDYQLQQIRLRETPLLNQLLENLDYSSEAFRNELAQKSLMILKSEQLSIEQVEILIKVVEQTKNLQLTQNSKALQNIETQMREMLEQVQHEQLNELPAEFLVAFKKPLPLNFLKNKKVFFLKIETSKIEFNKTVKDSQTIETKNLVTGDCENALVDTSLQQLKWQIASNQVCSLQQGLSQVQTSTFNFIEKNKNPLLVTGLIVLGAAILMNNYEVTLNF